MKVLDLDDPEEYRRYLKSNLRVLTMAPLRQANVNDLDTLEVISNLAEIWRGIQATWMSLAWGNPISKGREN